MKLHYLAQKICIGGQCIHGALQNGATEQDINNIGDVINSILTLVIPLGGVILFLVLIWGGYGFMFSQGNPEKVKAAKARITTGLIGFILLLISFLIVKIVSTVFFPEATIFK